MKCVYFWNKLQEPLKQCFEQSMKHFMPDVELVPIEFKYEAETSDFGTIDFKNLITEKVSVVKKFISEHIDEEIILSDIDIIIYKNFNEVLNLGDFDISFQKDSKQSDINTGFIHMKCNDLTFSLWETVEEKLKSHVNTFINEQVIINSIIRASKLKWKLFDDSIWAYSNELPSTIYLHHANCTSAYGNMSSYILKCRQLKEYMEKFQHPLRNVFNTILS